jgi:P27 family predicted phage terminase small subunit
MSAAAREVWDRLAGDLMSKGVLDGWSADSFARYCWLQATSERLRADLDREGYVVAGARGGEPVKSKLWTLLRQVDAELVQLEGRFGLTPADRSRVTIEEDAAATGRDPTRLLS